MINLINGDCLEEMAKLNPESIDLVLTDPPYGMSFVSNRRKAKYNKILGDDELSWVNDFSDSIFQLLRNNSAAYSFCSFQAIDVFKQAFERSGFKIKNLLVWEKNNNSMGDLKADFAPRIELVWFLQKGRRLINGKRDPNIFKFRKTGNINHPTEKPVDLLEYLISKFSDPGSTVLDPFMGSGSTGVACMNTGRQFVGIERDENYFGIAQKRISKAVTL